MMDLWSKQLLAKTEIFFAPLSRFTQLLPKYLAVTLRIHPCSILSKVMAFQACFSAVSDSNSDSQYRFSIPTCDIRPSKLYLYISAPPYLVSIAITTGLSIKILLPSIFVITLSNRKSYSPACHCLVPSLSSILSICRSLIHCSVPGRKTMILSPLVKLLAEATLNEKDPTGTYSSVTFTLVLLISVRLPFPETCMRDTCFFDSAISRVPLILSPSPRKTIPLAPTWISSGIL